MAARFRPANAAHASSSCLSRADPVAGMTHRFDSGIRADLAPQPAHTYVDDIRAWVEVVAPHRGEDALAADHLTRVLDQVAQHPELAVRQRGCSPVDGHLAGGHVERH